MISDYKEALQFVEDYFQLNYSSFLNKYFNTDQQKEISRNITPAKFRQLFGELSPAQLNIIKDNSSPYIAVAAGPGSGKTRVLVHKLASLLLMEDVKHEQLLMVTFSRAAATEFKKRLYGLIGNAAAFIEIKTFHSYCFDLLGKVGTIEKSPTIIKAAVEKIRNRDIEPNRITKTVLVIDEAQDMDVHEFDLIKVLMDRNEEMRVIAVGDDDQNIYEFRGASSKYLEQFINEKQAKTHELIENFRSRSNLVAFTNQFVKRIQHRLKKTPIVAQQREDGIIKVTQYVSSHLIEPVVKDVLSTDLTGTTCVLTRTNAEALQVTGLLIDQGLSAKLIQSNEGFNLYNLLEVRYFIEQLNFREDTYTISEEVWKQAKRNLWDKYRNSTKIDICINLIKEFQLSNPKKKFQSDFKVFIRESKMEDFIGVGGETIFVSTMHKAKGKEFDNVFLMLDDFNPVTDEAKRLLYVAMTRAKKNLSIHLNDPYLNDITVDHLVRRFNPTLYDPSRLLVLHLSHKDIWLDYFIKKQNLISRLKSGDALIVKNTGCKNEKGRYVLKFSNHFKEQLVEYKNQGYILSGGSVNYVVYWKKEDTDVEVRIVLPEVRLVKEEQPIKK
jgi:ATP-dependent DNA helicase RecQ